MKKLLTICAVVLVFLSVNMGYSQDCGKCPFKCKKAAVQPEAKKENTPGPMVYTNKNDKRFHRENCQSLKNLEGYSAVELSKALEAGLTACTVCNLPANPPAAEKTAPEPPQTPEKKDSTGK